MHERLRAAFVLGCSLARWRVVCFLQFLLASPVWRVVSRVVCGRCALACWRRVGRCVASRVSRVVCGRCGVGVLAHGLVGFQLSSSSPRLPPPSPRPYFFSFHLDCHFLARCCSVLRFFFSCVIVLRLFFYLFSFHYFGLFVFFGAWLLCVFFLCVSFSEPPGSLLHFLYPRVNFAFFPICGGAKIPCILIFPEAKLSAIFGKLQCSSPPGQGGALRQAQPKPQPASAGGGSGATALLAMY